MPLNFKTKLTNVGAFLRHNFTIKPTHHNTNRRHEGSSPQEPGSHSGGHHRVLRRARNFLSPSRPPTRRSLICGSETESNEAPIRTHSPSSLVNTPAICPIPAVAEGEPVNCICPSPRNSYTPLVAPRMSSDDEGLSTSTPSFSCRGNRASSSPDSLPEVLAMEAEAHNTASTSKADSDLSRSASHHACPTPLLLPAGIPHTIVVGDEVLHLQALPGSSASAYGTVLQAHGNDGKQYAVKIVKKPQILLVRSPSLYISTIESEGTQKQNTGACDLFRELAILRKLRDMSPQCPFICDFVEACQDENAVYMIMPLYEPLSFDHTISPDEFRTFAFQAVLAIDALHKNGIVHRDIKPENFVRHTSPSGDKVAVVIDFGMANSGALSNATGLWVAGNCGTVVYFASEMMKMLRNPRKEIYIPPYDGEKLDVHALGVTLLQWLWAILHVQDMKNIEYVPVYETGHARYNRDILRIDIEKALHLLKLLIADREDCIALSEALELIAEMTCPDPLERFGLEQVKSHAYFKGCRIQAGNSDSQASLRPRLDFVVRSMSCR